MGEHKMTLIESLRMEAAIAAEAGRSGEGLWRAGMEVLGKKLNAAAETLERLHAALSELYALVKGECPGLLNDDSGGDARLDLEIRELLK